MKSYNDICEEYNGRVPYHIQLDTKEWYDKRNKIILRDNHSCQNCQERCIDDYIPKFVYKDKLISELGIYTEVEIIKSIKLPFSSDTIEYPTTDIELVPVLNPLFPHVHHTYYIIKNLAWDYPDEALILLCHKCHSNFHKENIVPIYQNNHLGDRINLTPCSRCFGAGHFPEYNHVENGICFRCRGARYEELINK